jgi:hypothetical protein
MDLSLAMGSMASTIFLISLFFQMPLQYIFPSHLTVDLDKRKKKKKKKRLTLKLENRIPVEIG